MSVNGWFLVILSSLLAVCANLLLRAGVNKVDGVSRTTYSTLLHTSIQLAREPQFVIGLVLYGLTTMLWIKILSTEPLSIAYPAMVSISFALVTLGAVFFFQETLTINKIAGIIIVFSGLLIIAQG